MIFVQAILALIGILLVLAIPVGLLAILLIAFARTGSIGQLEERIAALERRLQGGPPGAPSAVASPDVLAAEVVSPAAPFPAAPPGIAPPIRAAELPPADATPSGWELVVGRSALGWIAIAALVLAAVTFLKYAFDNALIGPQGQLALVLLGGCLVLGVGYHYALAGWRIFAELLLAAGVAVIYLAAWAAMSYYYVVSQQVGSLFLLAIVVEAALLALVFDSWTIALAALLGGLATPLLMSSLHDNYSGLFLYLAFVNAGVVAILGRRSWSALGTIGLVGTQAIFAGWFWGYYHPEKLAWALPFQLVIWGLYLALHLGVYVYGGRPTGLEDLARLLLGAFLASAQLFFLLAGEYAPWLSLVAVAMAAVYVLVAHLAFRAASDPQAMLAALAAAAGLIAWAIALEASGPWVSVGWGVLGALLWLFGLRVSAWQLRLMGAVALVAAVLRLLAHDAPYIPRNEFWPILNEYAIPALVVVACVLAPAMWAWRDSRRLSPGENVLVVLAGIGGALLLGGVVSWDLYSWFALRVSTHGDPNGAWAGQVAVSTWWGVYALAMLMLGLIAERPAARWLALALFALTVAKVFFVDLANVDDFYRILALVALAVILAGAAWAYQRAQMRSAAA